MRIELVADLLCKLPDLLLPRDCLRGVVHQMGRHGMQAQNTRAQPLVPSLVSIEGIDRRYKIGRGKAPFKLCEHVGIDGAVIRLDGSSGIHGAATTSSLST